MGIEWHRNSEGISFRDRKISRAHCERVHKSTIKAQEADIWNNPEDEQMALSTEAKDWLQKNGLEGFIWVAEAPHHQEPEKVARTIDVEVISEATVKPL